MFGGSEGNEWLLAPKALSNGFVEGLSPDPPQPEIVSGDTPEQDLEKESMSDPAPIIVADSEPTEVETTVTIADDGPSGTPSGKPRDERFYFSFTTFEVEGILFRVPRHPFEAESQVFKDMFGIPSDSSADGSSDEQPLVLPGISANAFRAFLKVLLDPTTLDPKNALDKDEWTSLLHLSHMWCCDRLFALAISKLDTQITDPIARILLANVYGIKDWLVSAYLELVKRTQPLTLEETNKLGVESAVKLSEIRESRYRWIIDDLEEARSQAHPNHYSPYSSPGKKGKNLVRARSPVSFRYVRKDVGLLDADIRAAIVKAFNLA